MKGTQTDLFAQDSAERKRPSARELQAIAARLEATIARLDAATVFPWRDALEAAHEENRFERDAALLGDRGPALWARFDAVMERVYALPDP